ISQAGLDVHYVPGEHDFLDEGMKLYHDHYGKNAKGAGWYSFDADGVHFIGLVNVVNLKAGGLGNLGEEQLKWLAGDLQGKTPETPIVVFAHIPLWTVYEQWGWGPDDGARAIELLKRFGSVTVLNGHIHQVMQKVEGNVAFHTAMATGFPQPAPGAAPSPGPMKVPDDKLHSLLGITEVNFVRGQQRLAIIDKPLQGSDREGVGSPHSGRATGVACLLAAVVFFPGAVRAEDATAKIDNFTFVPARLTVKAGTTVTWRTEDDIPHTVTSSARLFKSKALDTDDSFSFTFTEPGTYEYFCSLHPRMTATIVVKPGNAAK